MHDPKPIALNENVAAPPIAFWGEAVVNVKVALERAPPEAGAEAGADTTFAQPASVAATGPL